MSANVVRLFFEAAERNRERLAFVVGARQPGRSPERVTFGELRARVERFAGGLRAAGFEPGSRAAFMLPMSTDLYVAVLGALAAGGVAVFVDPWVSVRQIARLAAAARPRAFVASGKGHLLRLLESSLRSIPITVATNPLGRIVARHHLRAMTGDFRLVETAADAPALITYTTGSSGNPKGVNRTHDILAAQHAVIREEFPARPDDVDYTTFPVFALSNLAAGITTVIPRINLRRIADASPEPILADLHEFGATTMAASPPVFDTLARHLGGPAARSSAGSATRAPTRLRRIVTGGAPVRDDQLQRWRAAFPDTEIVVAFGSSEAEPVASIGAGDRLTLDRRERSRHGGYCVGKPVAAVRTAVVPITTTPVLRVESVAQGAIGELLVSGPHVCRDYAGDEAAFRENKVRDSAGAIWHRMGDTGYFDAQGRFWLVGRVHSTIRRQGMDLHAQVVEAAARGDDARIRRIAAVGLPDPTLGQRLALVVESNDHEVRDGVMRRLAELQPEAVVDDLILTRKALPMDPRHNSKVDYARLRDMIVDGRIQ